MTLPLARMSALAVLLLPSIGSASPFLLPEEGATVAEPHHDVLLVQPSEGSSVLVERIALRSTAGRLLWMRAFRSEPTRVSPVALDFQLVSEADENPTPFADAVRSRPFGPSLLTPTLKAVFPEEPPPAPRRLLEGRALEVDESLYVSGRATTSTVTGAVTLPEALESLLGRWDLELDMPGRRRVGQLLNTGWGLFAAVLYDGTPNQPGWAVLGPIGFELSDEELVYPLEGSTAEDLGEWHGALVTPSPSAPLELPLVSLEESETTSGVVLSSATRLGTHQELALHLRDELSLSLGGDLTLTQLELKLGSARLDALHFRASEAAAAQTGAGPKRGGFLDLFSCLLLGLAPLILAPESWLLLWIQSRSRASARTGGSRFGVKLWAVWCLGVAIFWLLAVDELARIAALGPLLLGTIQLALPYTRVDPRPIRARFRRPKPSATAPETTATQPASPAEQP